MGRGAAGESRAELLSRSSRAELGAQPHLPHPLCLLHSQELPSNVCLPRWVSLCRDHITLLGLPPPQLLRVARGTRNRGVEHDAQCTQAETATRTPFLPLHPCHRGCTELFARAFLIDRHKPAFYKLDLSGTVDKGAKDECDGSVHPPQNVHKWLKSVLQNSSHSKPSSGTQVLSFTYSRERC